MNYSEYPVKIIGICSVSRRGTSADIFMPRRHMIRNQHRRVEVVCQVESQAILNSPSYYAACRFIVCADFA